jgi:hypothetical protein
MNIYLWLNESMIYFYKSNVKILTYLFNIGYLNQDTDLILKNSKLYVILAIWQSGKTFLWNYER